MTQIRISPEALQLLKEAGSADSTQRFRPINDFIEIFDVEETNDGSFELLGSIAELTDPIVQLGLARALLDPDNEGGTLYDRASETDSVYTMPRLTNLLMIAAIAHPEELAASALRALKHRNEQVNFYIPQYAADEAGIVYQTLPALAKVSPQLASEIMFFRGEVIKAYQGKSDIIDNGEASPIPPCGAD